MNPRVTKIISYLFVHLVSAAIILGAVDKFILQPRRELDRINLEKQINTIVHDNIILYQVGGVLNTEEECGIKEGEIAKILCRNAAWIDSLGIFYHKVWPGIKERNEIYDVGLKIDKKTGEIHYIHTDGKKYYPSYSDTMDWYHIYINGQLINCK